MKCDGGGMTIPVTLLPLVMLGIPPVTSDTLSSSDATTLGESCEEWERPKVTCHSFNWEGMSCAVRDGCEGARCQVVFGRGILRA